MVKLSQVVQLAEEAHQGDVWRDGKTPFLFHPLAVASLVLKYGGSMAQACAAVLHDLIDRPVAEHARLEREFGREIADLAHAFASPQGRDEDWNASRKAYIAQVKKLPDAAKLLVLCEELHEISELLRSLSHLTQPEVWKRYPVPAMNVAWYFKEIFVAIHSAWREDKDPARRALLSDYAKLLVELNQIVFESGPAGRA